MKINNLELYRKKAGYSQSKLSSLSKIPQTTICSWEHNIGEPSYSRAVLLAKLLDTTTERLFGDYEQLFDN